MDKMSEKDSKDFLQASGYRTFRKRMTCSCTLRELYELLESKVDESGQAEELVDGFLQSLEEELPDVMSCNVYGVVRGKMPDDDQGNRR